MLLARVRNLIEEAGYSIVNVDATVVMQRPAGAAYRPDAGAHRRFGRRNGRCQSHHHRRMGFEGRGEGALASAIATIIG